MVEISVSELHQNTDLWVRKAVEEGPVALTDNGHTVAKIVAVASETMDNPFLRRKLLPGFAELQAKLTGGTESTEIISDMRDGR